MKQIIFLIGLLILVGCNRQSSIEDYECNVGQRIGDKCFTEIETIELSGCSFIYPYEIQDMATRMDDSGLLEIKHLTSGNCMIEQMRIVDVIHFEINDSSIRDYLNEYNGLFVLRNDEDFKKDFCFNTTIEYHWERTIWNPKTSFKQCIEPIRRSGGEVLY